MPSPSSHAPSVDVAEPGCRSGPAVARRLVRQMCWHSAARDSTAFLQYIRSSRDAIRRFYCIFAVDPILSPRRTPFLLHFCSRSDPHATPHAVSTALLQ